MNELTNERIGNIRAFARLQEHVAKLASNKQDAELARLTARHIHDLLAALDAKCERVGELEAEVHAKNTALGTSKAELIRMAFEQQAEIERLKEQMAGLEKELTERPTAVYNSYYMTVLPKAE